MKRGADRAVAQQRYENRSDPADHLEWKQQREQISLSLGERVIDKSFDQVYRSLITSMASLGIGVAVQVAQKESGFISAKGEFSDSIKHLHNEGAREWARLVGYPTGVFDEFTWEYNGTICPAANFSWLKHKEILNITLVKQQEAQCKVKLRLSGVQYPKMLELCYQQIWIKLDKQIFLDKALD